MEMIRAGGYGRTTTNICRRWTSCLNGWKCVTRAYRAEILPRLPLRQRQDAQIHSDHPCVPFGKVQPDLSCGYHADGRNGFVAYRGAENGGVCGYPGQRFELQLYYRYALHPAFQQLYYQADIVHGGRLPVHVHFVMDEFANVALRTSSTSCSPPCVQRFP